MNEILKILIILISLFGFLYYLKKIRNRTSYNIREIDGLSEIETAIAGSTEQGRPVIFTSGSSGVGPLLTACLEILKFISKKTAKLKTEIIVPHYYPDVLAITEVTMSNVYDSIPNSKLPENANRYISDEQFAFTAGYQGIVQREKPGAAFLFGEYAAESLILAEAGRVVGAKQVAGTTTPEQVAFFVCACDKTLIGEEVFAASAKLSQDPLQLASIVITDRLKLIVLLIIIIGVLYKTVINI